MMKFSRRSLLESASLVLFVVVFSLCLTSSSARFYRRPASYNDGYGYSMYRQRKSEGESIGCKSVPSLKTYKFLNKICEDCFQLYRDAEVYALCRSDCFGSQYFHGCMDSLLVRGETKMQAETLVEDIHNFV